MLAACVHDLHRRLERDAVADGDENGARRGVRRAKTRAPHLAALSLFWLTRWGQSLIACEAVNAARMARGLAVCHELEVSRLRGELARVLAIAEFGCANDPLASNLHRFANRVQARA